MRCATRSTASAREAEDAVRGGCAHVILTDEKQRPDRARDPDDPGGRRRAHPPVRQGLRTFTSLNVRSAECLDAHYFAVLIGVGATTVNAYLARGGDRRPPRRGLFGELALEDCLEALQEGGRRGPAEDHVQDGHLGDLLLSRRLQFRGRRPVARAGRRILPRHAHAHLRHRPGRHPAEGAGAARPRLSTSDVAALPIGGFYRYRRGGETPRLGSGPDPHAAERGATATAIRPTSNYTEAMRQAAAGRSAARPARLPPGARTPVPLDEVEASPRSASASSRPACRWARSSPEAHETLTIAMNRIGAKSDTGEGGEDPTRFTPRPTATTPTPPSSRSPPGRFGVTAEYLNDCREIEIKVAQGAKPGEGGQLPGFKVTELIAKLRHATPGVIADLAAAAPRHLLDRGSGAAHLRPEADQPGRARLREAGRAVGHRHHRRRRRQGQGRRDPGLRPCRRHRRLARRPRSSMPACPGRWACPRPTRC